MSDVMQLYFPGERGNGYPVDSAFVNKMLDSGIIAHCIIEPRRFGGVHVLVKECRTELLLKEILKMAKPKKFWMCVVVPVGGGPTFQHPSRAEAEKEAERLAKKTHCEVYVLEAVQYVKVADVVREDL